VLPKSDAINAEQKRSGRTNADNVHWGTSILRAKDGENSQASPPGKISISWALWIKKGREGEALRGPTGGACVTRASRLGAGVPFEKKKTDEADQEYWSTSERGEKRYVLVVAQIEHGSRNLCHPRYQRRVTPRYEGGRRKGQGPAAKTDTY